MISKVQNPNTVAPLFAGWDETLIWSCLQQIMGSLYADSLEHPQSAVAILGDFAFYAGEPNEELVRYKPEGLTQALPHILLIQTASKSRLTPTESTGGKDSP